ncbi:hypothetical protein PG984_002702 [Apiospora sp. TS-2023a]
MVAAPVIPVDHGLLVAVKASLAPLVVVVDAGTGMGPDALGAVAFAAGTGGLGLVAQLNHLVLAHVAAAVLAGPLLLVLLAHGVTAGVAIGQNLLLGKAHDCRPIPRRQRGVAAAGHFHHRRDGPGLGRIAPPAEVLRALWSAYAEAE